MFEASPVQNCPNWCGNINLSKKTGGGTSFGPMYNECMQGQHHRGGGGARGANAPMVFRKGKN